MLVCVTETLEVPADAESDANPWVDGTTRTGQSVMGDRTAMGAEVTVVRVRDDRTSASATRTPAEGCHLRTAGARV